MSFIDPSQRPGAAPRPCGNYCFICTCQQPKDILIEVEIISTEEAKPQIKDLGPLDFID